MKILELRFKNLNSLYGEWFIDFTDPEYESNGIFALTGPTGAGKSTILDAICLALYGATPRLGKITKSANDIMSRQTGECYAEVLFQSQAGRFRCHWGQHRARKKADGELQPPRHEIAEAENNHKVIESQIRRVATVMEEKTGMDFERFTRSILLAQGNFDTFLKADIEQKSKILEQITGTGIYTEISKRVHERQRDEHEKLKFLQAETSGILLLEPEKETEIQRDVESKQKAETELTALATETEKAMAWLTGIDGLKMEIGSLAEESQKLQKEIECFKPDRGRLNQAMKAVELDGDYATVIAVREQLETDRTSLKREEHKRPRLEADAQKKLETLKTAEERTLKAKENLQTAAPLIQTIRSLDQRMADKKKALESGKAECRKDAVAIETDKRLRIKEQAKHDTALNELKLVQKYLEAHSRDEWLVGGLAGIREQIANLLSVQKEMTTKAADEKKAGKSLNATIKKLADCTARLNKRKKELADSGKRLLQGKKDLALLLGDRLLREYRSEKETLLREMAYLRRIADLEDHRVKLEDGKPCPLCGAKHHPFAEGNVPQTGDMEKKIEDLTKLIEKAEEQTSRIETMATAERDALKNLSDSEKLENTAANEKQATEKRLVDLTKDLESMALKFTRSKTAALAKLRPLGIEKIPDSGVSTLLKSLQDRRREWLNQIQKKNALEKQISDLDGELKRLDAVIDTRSKALAEKQRAMETVLEEYEAENSERRKLFGDKNPDAEENRLKKSISNAEHAEKTSRAAYDETKQALNAARTNILSLRERVGKKIPELEDLESRFAGRLQSAGFENEKRFLEARLTGPVRDEFKEKAKDLDRRQTDLRARQKDREDRLSLEIAKNLTDAPLQTLAPQFKEIEEDLKQLRDVVAALKHELNENTAAKERIKEKQAFIEAQKKECRRWEKLHGLIGSADGKKYRNFAQGLTFELMVSHANSQLVKMTDRYLLIRDETQPLELNVVDNYQAGEIRSTRNLSGGESFIVSLALALGLSQMASRKVRVDSLFLDEGFGTLDEETLETSLETLAGLHQNEKIIGIISHVSALKERISAQITITPVSGGKSAITGPGVQQSS
ncbi:putative nuclease sbcCD, subunit C [delta proteobacterium NaphS2]|nr:putative nuclease sbcCD, subunit C [delta proteobacterium NaphS2]